MEDGPAVHRSMREMEEWLEDDRPRSVILASDLLFTAPGTDQCTDFSFAILKEIK